MTRNVVVWLVLLGIGGYCLSAIAAPYSTEAQFYLFMGWAYYPARLLPDADVIWPIVGVGLGSLSILSVGLQLFCQWLALQRKTVWCWRWTFGIVALLFILMGAGIAGLGITDGIHWLATTKELEAQTRRGPPKVGPRTQSNTNLKNLALSAYGFQEDKMELPTGGTFDAHGRGMHGWQTSILPFIDQMALFHRIDLKEPWTAPGNAGAMNTHISVFQHPLVDMREQDGYSLSHYAGNMHVFGLKAMKIDDISDGAANTVMMGEVAALFKPWGMPMNCRDPMLGLNAADGFASPEGKAVQLAFADGTVRSVRPNISPAVLKAISTPRGGEQVNPGDFER